jgi:hypothetical protein
LSFIGEKKYATRVSELANVNPFRQFANFQIHLANRLSLFFKAWRLQFDKCQFANSPIRRRYTPRRNGKTARFHICGIVLNQREAGQQ